jgi:hypothetical protein
VFAAAAVVVGVAIGVAATALNKPDETEAVPPTTRTSPTTTTTTTSADPADPAVNNPAYAPVLALDDQGDRITLTWTDPSAGDAEFVVVDATGPSGNALQQLPAGVTTYTVEGVDPGSRHCYVVAAFGLTNAQENRGVSAEVCTDR